MDPAGGVPESGYCYHPRTYDKRMCRTRVHGNLVLLANGSQQRQGIVCRLI